MEVTISQEVIDKWFARPVAFHRIFVELTGSVQAALMLSQAYYWTPRVSRTDGFFYKTADEWRDETGLSRHEQTTARKYLKTTKFWKEKLTGVPATCHFRVDKTALFLSLTELAKLDSQIAVSPPTSLPDYGKHSYTETTQETTPVESNDSTNQMPFSEDLFGEEERIVESSSEPQRKKGARAKKEKTADPLFVALRDIFHEEYPIMKIGFNGAAAGSLREIVKFTRAHIEGMGEEFTIERAINNFRYIIAYVKRTPHFCNGKPLTTWGNQYVSIIQEIYSGNGGTKKSSRANTADFIRNL